MKSNEKLWEDVLCDIHAGFANGATINYLHLRAKVIRGL